MGGPHGAESVGHRAAGDVVHLQQLQSCAGTHHVDDGVDAAHLVEVHVGHRLTVQVRLSFCQRPKDRCGAFHHPVGQRRVSDEVQDVAGGSRCRHSFVDHVHLGAGDAASHHLFRLHRPAGHIERRAHVHHLGEWGAGVHQCAQGHVSGDAREAVEPRNPAVAHGSPAGRPRWRSSAMAAPNPLSMPTTDRPAAQLASMPNSAVTPSRLDP